MSAHPVITTCPILHQDACFIVVNKPSGVLSHPNAAGKPQRSAFEGRYNLEEKRFQSAAGSVWLVHRLDQDTSGVLIGALDAGTARKCREAFEAGRVKKQYLALVGGTPPPRGTWRDCLVVSRDKKAVRTTVKRGGRPNAELHFQVLRQNRERRLALLEIDLVTGRTHQIRVQAASRHCPVVGDDVYGDFDLNHRLRKSSGIHRLCLHAHQIELPHPGTGRTLCVSAPLPDDLAGLV